MIVLGLTPSRLAREAEVAVGSVENVFKRERAGVELGRLGPAELKVRKTLDRLEVRPASTMAPERVSTTEGDVAIAMYQGLSVEARRDLALEIAKRYFEEHR